MKKVYVVLIYVFLFFTACQKEKDSLVTPPIETGEVSEETALLVARTFEASVLPEKGKRENARISAEEKSLKKSTTIKGENGELLFYVITYEQGGFALVSADRNSIPVLAHSTEGDFPVDQELPISVRNMVTFYKNQVREAKTKKSQTKEIAAMWARFEKGTLPVGKGARTATEPEDGCEDEYEYIAPLLNTTWGQECGYNANMPAQFCTACNLALVGCVPVSISQVMRYYSFPNTFNWGIMNNTTPATETARLMRDVFDNNGAITDCSGTWSTQASIRATLLVYGYSTAITSLAYNLNTVKNELRAGRPVILTGFDAAVGGHAWVCDGFLDYYLCDGSLYQNGMHMNWGWAGNWNGNYFYPNPNGLNFSTNQMMTINIQH